MERIPLQTAISRNVTSNNQQITCFAYLVKRRQVLAWSKLHWLSSMRKIFLKWQKWQFLEILQDSSRADFEGVLQKGKNDRKQFALYQLYTI